MHRPWMADGGVMLAGLGLIAFTGGPINDDRSPAAPGHRWHHDDPEALIAAPFFALALVLVGLWGLFRWGLGDEAASWLVGALITGFLYYELLHHRLHHGRLPVRAFRIPRSHHRIHHQFPDRNFGVTMTVW